MKDKKDGTKLVSITFRDREIIKDINKLKELGITSKGIFLRGLEYYKEKEKL